MTKPEKNLRKRLERLVHFDEVFPQKLNIHLTTEEITNQLLHKTGYDMYLNEYTKEEIKEVLIREGIWGKIMEQGFKNLIIEMDTSDPYHQRLCLYFDKVSQSNLLAQIILSTGTFTPKKDFLKSVKVGKMNMLIIEWLCLQNPLKNFTSDKPRLPGQDYPGLGVGRMAVELIKKVALNLEKDGVLNYPQYYHNAVMYSEIFRFYNPEIYGKMLAIKELLKNFSIAESAWIVYSACIIDKIKRTRFIWRPEEMILPLSQTLKNYFSSSEYDEKVSEAISKSEFSIDFKRYEKIKKSKVLENYYER